jgi:O-acetyl-ADP-ribose deacetylase (regulator of RNase III)
VTGRVRVWRGDITTLDVDAIVNAANATLLGGGGVDGAIHRAAGPELTAHCRTLGGCPTGDARITPGFRLRARWVIHTVGPVWRGGAHGEPGLLAACYRRSLELAEAHALDTIAFPAISTGVYGYPLEAAARIAVDTVLDFLAVRPRPRDVILCAFDAHAARILEAARALRA